jgi:hypothetical protein
MPVPPAALRTRLDDFPLMEKRLLEVASNDETVRRAPDRFVSRSGLVVRDPSGLEALAGGVA